MTYAIIETSGTQLRVEPGRFYDINRLPVEPDGTMTIDKVLLVKHEDNIHVGQPLVEGGDHRSNGDATHARAAK